MYFLDRLQFSCMNISVGNLFQKFIATVFENYSNNQHKFIQWYLYLFFFFPCIFISIPKWTFSISDMYLLLHVIIFYQTSGRPHFYSKCIEYNVWFTAITYCYKLRMINFSKQLLLLIFFCHSCCSLSIEWVCKYVMIAVHIIYWSDRCALLKLWDITSFCNVQCDLNEAERHNMLGFAHYSKYQIKIYLDRFPVTFHKMFLTYF